MKIRLIILFHILQLSAIITIPIIRPISTSSFNQKNTYDFLLIHVITVNICLLLFIPFYLLLLHFSIKVSLLTLYFFEVRKIISLILVICKYLGVSFIIDVFIQLIIVLMFLLKDWFEDPLLLVWMILSSSILLRLVWLFHLIRCCLLVKLLFWIIDISLNKSRYQ